MAPNRNQPRCDLVTAVLRADHPKWDSARPNGRQTCLNDSNARIPTAISRSDSDAARTSGADAPANALPENHNANGIGAASRIVSESAFVVGTIERQAVLEAMTIKP